MLRLIILPSITYYFLDRTPGATAVWYTIEGRYTYVRVVNQISWFAYELYTQLLSERLYIQWPVLRRYRRPIRNALYLVIQSYYIYYTRRGSRPQAALI